MDNLHENGFKGVIGVAQVDVTPPKGVYARNWGAAIHDTAIGVHRQLLLTCVTLQVEEDGDPLIVVSADFCTWRNAEDGEAIRLAILREFGVQAERLMYCLSHTHAGPILSREVGGKPGGEYIKGYLQELENASVHVVRKALASRVPAVLEWKYGKCTLATNRDFYDHRSGTHLTGYNPDGVADDTLLVGRITDMEHKIIGTFVNYACHPTTLGWENRLVSPDYIGAMRELVFDQTHAPCLFLQGASGDLAPREQYVADPAIADKNGRELGFAVLSVLASMLPPQTSLTFGGSVKSGADLAIWKRRAKLNTSTLLKAEKIDVWYELKPLPSFSDLDEQYRNCADHVERERLWRKRNIRKALGDGERVSVSLWIWQLGGAVFVGQPNEAYSEFQLVLRKNLSVNCVAVINLVNGSAGYLPPADLYDSDCYSVWQTPFAKGSLEKLLAVALEQLK